MVKHMPRRNRVQHVIIHCSDDARRKLLNKINEFHVDLIERRLSQEIGLTGPEKVAIVDQIVALLQSKERNGIIK